MFPMKVDNLIIILEFEAMKRDGPILVILVNVEMIWRIVVTVLIV